ncbi:hypothetical protein BH10CYA1_BH10CYA1_60080 [soil metagenome]
MLDRDSLTDGLTTSQRNLAMVLLNCDIEFSERVDVVLVEALDARDLGHKIEADSLFQEALSLISLSGKPDDYMFLPVLLHYCAFLHECGRLADYECMIAEFRRIEVLYEWST